ncbi:hypothetical protein Tco_0723228 [Tanacetum coccineum]
MMKLSVDLKEPKDSSKTDKAAQNGRTSKSLTLEIHHGGWFTPTPSRYYIGGHVSSVNVVDIDEFCLHDLKDMVVKLGYGVEDLMYCHFLIPSLGLDYGLHSLNVDADVLEMANFVKAPIVVDSVEDPFEELDDILGEYAHIGKQITRNEITRNKSTGNEITGKQMVVHVGNSSTLDDVLEWEMLFETEGVGHVGKFKEVEVDADNELEEESDTEGDYTMNNDSADLDYNLKHDNVFDDDGHIVKEIHVNMNNFRFTADPKHDTSIDDEIDSKRRMQLRELRRIGKQKNKGPNKYYFYLGQQFASKEIMKGRVKKHSVETRRQLILVKMIMKGWEVRTLIEDHTCIQSRAIKACTSRFLAEHVIKSLATNLDIHVRAIQDQMHKQFEAQLFGLIYNKNQIQSLLPELLEGCPWPGQILIAVGVDVNNGIYPVAYAIVEAERKRDLYKPLQPSAKQYCVRHIHKNIKSQFKRDSIRRIEQALFFRQSQMDMWPVVESRTIIIPPLYKPPIGRPPKKRKKSNDEIASQSASSGKLSRKGKSVSYGKCSNVGHNRKGCRGQGGVSSQAIAREVSSQVVGATNVYDQAASARKVSGQAAGSRKVSGQVSNARKASSQPSATQSTTKQGPRIGFQEV